MIVSELIFLLQSFQPDMRVVTAGFDEGGVVDIETVEMRKIIFNVRSSGLHYGPHDQNDTGVPAVWIDW